MDPAPAPVIEILYFKLFSKIVLLFFASSFVSFYIFGYLLPKYCIIIINQFLCLFNKN